MDNNRKAKKASSRRVRGWREELGIGNTKFHDLLNNPDLAPRSVKVGGSRIMLETPIEYLERIAAAQERESA